jgi:phosphatidylethanolamine-binding protein (PEBP) family uncharacterized protein
LFSKGQENKFIFKFSAAGCLIINKREIFAQEKEGRVMEITSSSFKQDDMIPVQHTCDDRNISPQLA